MSPLGNLISLRYDEWRKKETKKPAKIQCFGKPQNDINEAARDIKLPMLS